MVFKIILSFSASLYFTEYVYRPEEIAMKKTHMDETLIIFFGKKTHKNRKSSF